MNFWSKKAPPSSAGSTGPTSLLARAATSLRPEEQIEILLREKLPDIYKRKPNPNDPAQDPEAEKHKMEPFVEKVGHTFRLRIPKGFDLAKLAALGFNEVHINNMVLEEARRQWRVMGPDITPFTLESKGIWPKSGEVSDKGFGEAKITKISGGVVITGIVNNPTPPEIADVNILISPGDGHKECNYALVPERVIKEALPGVIKATEAEI